MSDKATHHANSQPSSLPNYNPAFVRKAAIYSAASCVCWLAIALCILTFVDPSNSQCPGWMTQAQNGSPTSLWVIVGLFSAVPTIWICIIVLRWKSFSRKIYRHYTIQPDGVVGVAPGFFLRKYYPPANYDYNFLLAGVCLFWSLFSAIPLVFMLMSCTGLAQALYLN